MNATEEGDQPLGESPEIVLDLSVDNAGRHVPVHLHLGTIAQAIDVERRWRQLPNRGGAQ